MKIWIIAAAVSGAFLAGLFLVRQSSPSPLIYIKQTDGNGKIAVAMAPLPQCPGGKGSARTGICYPKRMPVYGEAVSACFDQKKCLEGERRSMSAYDGCTVECASNNGAGVRRRRDNSCCPPGTAHPDPFGELLFAN